MTFYFAMVNAWSLLGSIVSGTFEEDYPILDKSKDRWSEEDEIRELDDYYDFKNVGAGNTAHEDDGLDYEVNLYDGSSADYYDDYMADVDEQRAHHFKTGNVELNYQPQHAHFYKYHEEEIL